MKYLRTEDGRIKNRSKLICYAFREDYISDDWDRDIERCLNSPIIKQSDNIEDLCDEFIGIRKSNHKPYIGRPSGFSWFQETNGWIGRLDDYESIYGAIWVFDNEGTPTLKSVTQMRGALPDGRTDWKLL